MLCRRRASRAVANLRESSDAAVKDGRKFPAVRMAQFQRGPSPPGVRDGPRRDALETERISSGRPASLLQIQDRAAPRVQLLKFQELRRAGDDQRQHRRRRHVCK